MQGSRKSKQLSKKFKARRSYVFTANSGSYQDGNTIADRAIAEVFSPKLGQPEVNKFIQDLLRSQMHLAASPGCIYSSLLDDIERAEDSEIPIPCLIAAFKKKIQEFAAQPNVLFTAEEIINKICIFNQNFTNFILEDVQNGFLRRTYRNNVAEYMHFPFDTRFYDFTTIGGKFTYEEVLAYKFIPSSFFDGDFDSNTKYGNHPQVRVSVQVTLDFSKDIDSPEFMECNVKYDSLDPEFRYRDPNLPPRPGLVRRFADLVATVAYTIFIYPFVLVMTAIASVFNKIFSSPEVSTTQQPSEANADTIAFGENVELDQGVEQDLQVEHKPGADNEHHEAGAQVDAPKQASSYKMPRRRSMAFTSSGRPSDTESLLRRQARRLRTRSLDNIPPPNIGG